MKAQNFVTDVMVPSVQTLYVFRIYRLSGGRKIVPTILVSGVAAHARPRGFHCVPVQALMVAGAWAVALTAGHAVSKVQTIDGISNIRVCRTS
jgi:hypothetical protein